LKRKILASAKLRRVETTERLEANTVESVQLYDQYPS
jgi:hypothetical protein